eukprot:3537370-Rhodomonas_salina.1
MCNDPDPDPAATAAGEEEDQQQHHADPVRDHVPDAIAYHDSHSDPDSDACPGLVLIRSREMLRQCER